MAGAFVCFSSSCSSIGSNLVLHIPEAHCKSAKTGDSNVSRGGDGISGFAGDGICVGNDETGKFGDGECESVGIEVGLCDGMISEAAACGCVEGKVGVCGGIIFLWFLVFVLSFSVCSVLCFWDCGCRSETDA